MKGLILKDLYNISHNAKSMFFILLFFAVVFLPSSGTQGYMFTCTLLCTMMIVTTFTFDEFSNWTPYALIMPVSRENLVAGKYIVLVIFSAAGTLFGLLAGLIGTRIAGNFVSVSGPADNLPLGLTAIASLAVSTICGGMSIPLTFRFGPEKGRLLVLVSFFIPSIICYIVYRLLLILGIVLTDELIVLFLYCSPLLALVWNFAMYRISCAILSKKEF